MKGIIGSGCGSFQLVRCRVGRKTVIAGVVSYMLLCWVGGVGGLVSLTSSP